MTKVLAAKLVSKGSVGNKVHKVKPDFKVNEVFLVKLDPLVLKVFKVYLELV